MKRIITIVWGLMHILFDVPDPLPISLYPALCSKILIYIDGHQQAPLPSGFSDFVQWDAPADEIMEDSEVWVFISLVPSC